MKNIKKLMTTIALLLIGALGCMGATDANDTKNLTDETNAQLGGSGIKVGEYMKILQSKTVEELVDNLKTKERFMKFAKMVQENNPQFAKKVEDFIKENKDKELKDIDKAKLKEAFKDLIPTFKAKTK
jgi:ElaB/YqjD/DUF883 family membrane-anchored ribosome-binding protein